MGSGATKLTCPSCKSFATSSGQLFVDHIHSEHPLGCLKCGETGANPPRKPKIHIGIKNTPDYDDGNTSSIPLDLSCPKCNARGLRTEKALADHMLICLSATHSRDASQMHPQSSLCTDTSSETSSADQLLCAHINTVETKPETAPPLPVATIACPRCAQAGFTSGEAFLTHLENEHNLSTKSPSGDLTIASQNTTQGRSLPKVGDKVLAMWFRAMWQYFPATVVKFMPDTMKYEIDWDDGDTTGRIVDYSDLAVDRAPNPNEVGIGSVILFPQGSYRATETQVTGGTRWHQGEITKIYEAADGQKAYCGRHTKGPEHGKSTEYPEYAFEFNDLKLHELRIGPNVFDIIGEQINTDEEVGLEDVDIFFSYTMADSPSAIRDNQISVPDNYKNCIEDMCDPLDILAHLRAKGLKVIDEKRESNNNAIRTAKLLKHARVFIACISDQYVKDEQCRMQFQYAKTTLKKPVVPLVVGDSSFEWTFSMVGLLIAGELYIHFKNKAVEEAKHQELLRSLNNYLQAAAVNDGPAKQQVTGDADLFISYCWTNSQLAHDAKQIDKLVGDAQSDPRRVKQYLDSCGYTTWLDIERLHSANADSGLFEQLTKGIIAARVVVPFISDEYASSPNCRMEFQFALKTLKKPIVPVLVGTGSKWKESVVGALICTLDEEPVNLQDITSEAQYNMRLQEIRKRLSTHENLLKLEDSSPMSATKNASKGRAPKVGDHVLSHHYSWNYYMATVVSYDPVRMEYTVNWDDGDSTGRVQPFNQVAVDQQPDADEIGVGSVVFFPQGTYGSPGATFSGTFYHEGVVTKVDRTASGEVLVSGHHTKGPAEGKTYYHYNTYEFTDLPISSLRMAPTALDAVLI